MKKKDNKDNNEIIVLSDDNFIDILHLMNNI